MDIRSGTVSFGATCPGKLMQQLQSEDADNVRNIKSLQTSFSRTFVTWQCHAICKDPSIVTGFLQSIGALEDLSILNYEPDISVLWPAIFAHQQSLKSLAIHTPPQRRLDVWNASALKEVTEKLPGLTKLELDLSLEVAERIIRTPATDALPQEEMPVLNQLTNMQHLESLRINVTLMDTASSFADIHTWNAMGCISFPPLNKEAGAILAQRIFDGFHAQGRDSALRQLEVRFARRCWDDRGQFWTLAHSVHARCAGEGGPAPAVVEVEPQWKEYLPKWPADGILWRLSREGYEEYAG